MLHLRVLNGFGRTRPGEAFPVGQTLGQTASFRQTAPETWCQSRYEEAPHPAGWKRGGVWRGQLGVGKPGTASQFQRRELVAVPALRRAHRSAFSRESRYEETSPGKPGTASQFQRRELVAVPVLRRTLLAARPDVWIMVKIEGSGEIWKASWTAG